MRAALVAALLLGPSLVAQDPKPARREREEPRFRVAMGLAGGEFEFDTERSLLDGETDAGLFRLQFEGVSRRGIGGGVRFESLGTDDDLFNNAGFAPTEAWNGTVFGHFTYRFEQHRFIMPMRAGLMSNFVGLDEQGFGSGEDVAYWSFGPYFEFAPEVILARSGRTRSGAPGLSWSLYGEFGFGFGGTYIDVDNDFREYESVTFFSGLEVGTRLTLGAIELGVAYLGRFQTMDESDPEGFPSLVAFGYDADFQGLLLTFGVRF